MDILKLLDLLFAIIMSLGGRSTNKINPSLGELIKARNAQRAGA